jgi:hypothetical protein
MSTTDTRIHRFCLCLELMSGMTDALNRAACEWSFSEWWQVLDEINPIDARCLVLRLIHGLEWPDVGERLEVSRARAQQRYQRALRLLGRTPQVIQLCVDSYTPKARTA